MAIDGIPFRTIAESEILREAFPKFIDEDDNSTGRPKSFPASHSSVQSIIVKHSDRIKKDVIKELGRNKIMSITSDEYTSLRNRKYINMNSHQYIDLKSVVTNLGVSRAMGSLPAPKLKSLMEQHLSNFEVDFGRDVVCLVTDGAEVMKCLGRKVDCYHLVCMIHGIHLSVVDVLFPKKKEDQPQLPTFEGDSDIEDMEEDDETMEMSYEHTETGTQELEIIPKYHSIIEKVRQKCREYRRSAVENDDFLQKVMREKYGKEISLILDVKTRWNSTKEMISRFLEVHEEVRLATIQAKNDWNFTDDDMKALRNLTAALEPLELGIKKLGSKGMNLIGAECVYQYMIQMFQQLDSCIARRLEAKFIRRLGERRHPALVHLILFLKDPSFWDKEKDFHGFRIQKRKIKKLATEFVNRLFPEDVASHDHTMHFSNDEDHDVTFFGETEMTEEPQVLSNAEKLEKLCAEALNETDECSPSKDTQPANVGEEMEKFAKTRFRTPLLTKLFNALKTIPPSSIEK